MVTGLPTAPALMLADDILVQGLRELRRVCKPCGILILLEHMRPGGSFLGPLFDFLNPIVVRLVGSNINRKTSKNISISLCYHASVFVNCNYKGNLMSRYFADIDFIVKPVAIPHIFQLIHDSIYTLKIKQKYTITSRKSSSASTQTEN